MKKIILNTIFLFLSVTAHADPAQPHPKCLELARDILETAFSSQVADSLELATVENKIVYDVISDANENVQILMFENVPVVYVETLPDYYRPESCELKSVNIIRH